MRTLWGHWGNCFFFAFYTLGLCPSLSQTPEQPKQLKGIVGGSITFPAPVLKSGSLAFNSGNAAVVAKGSSETDYILQFTGRLQWDSQTGLFTIRHLRTEDSGIFVVDSKEEQKKHFQLDVYKNVSTPTVMWKQLGRKNCSALCSVENGREVTLSWQKDGETLSFTSSPDINTSLSLPLKIDREGHHYYCETKNPVSSQRYLLDIPSNCTEDSGHELPEAYRKYTVPLAVLVCSLLLVLGLGLYLRRRKWHFTQGLDSAAESSVVGSGSGHLTTRLTSPHLSENTNTPGQSASDCQYAEISPRDQTKNQQNKLTTVYDELQPYRGPAAAEEC